MNTIAKSQNGITCAVCTFDSVRTLTATLESLSRQEIEQARFEILLIDNGGNPETRAIADNFSPEGPFTFRYIREEEIGLSRARNRAVEEANFPVIAFIDDDAEAEPQWAEVLLQAFNNDQVWAAGGKVKPKWECDRPYWLTDNMLQNLSIVSWGNENRWLHWPERVIGTNMAFRISVLSELGGFDQSLGRNGKKMGSMEDTVLQEYMASKSKFTYYLHNAVVYHLVPASRCSLRYFFFRSYGHEMSRMKLNKSKGAKYHLRTRCKLILKSIICMIKAVNAKMFSSKEAGIYSLRAGSLLGRALS